MEEDLEGGTGSSHDEMNLEEETYVNLQFFMQKRRNTGDSSAGKLIPCLSSRPILEEKLSDFL